MLTHHDLHGCYVALISPMTRIGSELVLDIPKFREVLRTVVEAGCTGVVIAGTTGQSAALTIDEKLALLHEAGHYGRDLAAALGRRLQVIAAAGSNDTHEAVRLTRRIASAAEVDGFLHVTGYYNNPPQAGLRRHFQAVADAAAETSHGVILYNVPSRTKSHLEARAVESLAAHPAIIGLKEACGDITHVQDVLSRTEGMDFSVLSGEDDQVAAIMALGGTGVISASANRWPREFQALTELAAVGDYFRAEELQRALLPCVRAVFSAKNPIPLHAMFETELRLPMVRIAELDEDERLRAEAVIREALAIHSFPHSECRALPLASA